MQELSTPADLNEFAGQASVRVPHEPKHGPSIPLLTLGRLQLRHVLPRWAPSGGLVTPMGIKTSSPTPG